MQRFSASGFTLLELLTAIAIVAILLGIGVPSFSEAMRRNRIASVTNDLSAAFALARSEAVKRGMPVTVCGSNIDLSACGDSMDWSGGLLVFHDDSGVAGTLDGSDEVIQKTPGAVDKNVTLSTDRNFLTFRSNGSAVLPAATVSAITIVPNSGCTGTDARAVSVNGSGRSAVTKLLCP
jgi:type IV fimbrial biogenesis protein FimT